MDVANFSKFSANDLLIDFIMGRKTFGSVVCTCLQKVVEVCKETFEMWQMLIDVVKIPECSKMEDNHIG